jgi:hypothetical protein
MKKAIFGTIAVVLVATAVAVYSADEQKRGGMMQGMKGMMGEQKSEEQSHDMMQGMKEMMAKMSKMMDMCSQMMASTSEQKKEEPSK